MVDLNGDVFGAEFSEFRARAAPRSKLAGVHTATAAAVDFMRRSKWRSGKTAPFSRPAPVEVGGAQAAWELRHGLGHAWRVSPGTHSARTQSSTPRTAPRTALLLRSHRSSVSGSNPPAGFHQAMGHILICAQAFGLLPVYGVLSPSPAQLRYRARSVRVAYGLLLFVGVIFIEAVAVRHMVLTLNADTFGVLGSGIGAATAGAVFYGNALMGAYLFLKLAARWPGLMASWADMERTLPHSGKQPSIALRFSGLTALVMLLALGEHILSIINAVPRFIDTHWYGKTTPADNSGENGSPSQGLFFEFLEEYSHSSHGFVFNHVAYHPVAGLAVFVLSKVTTFTWNFMDLFLMLVSTGLAERFKQFNAIISESDIKAFDREDWRVVREHFAVLSALTKNVDYNVCAIVFLSFGNNLYFICLQLLNGLSPSSLSWVGTIYFFYSFGFLLGRTVMVTLITARIHDQSKEALSGLFNCPSDTYCVEVARLQHQMASDDLALTGLRFFSITRNFMLAVAGAIATYEIVLLQFNVAISTPPATQPTPAITAPISA